MGTSRFSDRKTVVALALLCCLLWGSSYPAIKTGYEWFGIAAQDVPTKLVFAGWRFLWAGLALLALALATRRQVWGLGAGAARQLVVLGLAQKYDRKMGIGMLIAALLPYSIAIGVCWTIFLLVWFWLGWPVGPGGPIYLNTPVGG